MLQTSARLLALLSLLQARRDWPGEVLAERLGVSPRTVRRDVDRLRDLGYPVRSSKGREGGYRLGAGAELPPLLLDDEQAVAVAVALRTATLTVPGIEEAAARALTTIRQVMPSRLRHRVDALEVTPVTPTRGRSRPVVDTELLLTIGGAIRAREVFRFDYVAVGRSADEPGPGAEDGPPPAPVPPRRVEPHHLVTWGGRWYLIGWDVDRADWRTFRVDRITPRTPTGPRFTPRPLPTPDVAEYVNTAFGRTEWPCEGEAVVHTPAGRLAPWVADRAVVEAIGPDRCRVVAGSWSWVGLAAWLAMFDVEVEIVRPDALRRAAADLSARFGRAAAAPAPPAGAGPGQNEGRS